MTRDWVATASATRRSVSAQISGRSAGRISHPDAPGVARTHMDAPEIDGTVFVDKKLPVGEFANVTIRDWRGYDLVAHK